MKRASNREDVKQIVHLVRRYSPMIGGVEKHLEFVNKEFIKRGYRVIVITEKTEEHLKNYEIISGVKVIRLPVSSELTKNNFFGKLNFKLNIWKSIWRRRELLTKADIIQIHDVFFWILPFWVFYTNKMYITFHGYEGNNIPKRTQIFWHWIASKLTRNNLCIGGFHQKWFKVNPGLISYGAVEANHKTDDTSNRKSNKTIMYIGRLERDTGIMEYLVALKKLHQKSSEFSLDVFGDGSQKNEAELFVMANSLKAKFHGFTKDAVDSFIKYDQIFASRYLAIIEALSAGKKVIAYYDNQIKYDYLKLSPFCDWIAIVGSADEIYEATINYKPKNLNQAKKWADAQTWVKMADNYEGLWK